MALFTAEGTSQSASNIITPGHWAISFLSYLGSMMPVQQICTTKLNQSQQPSLPSQVPIYPWVKRSVLLMPFTRKPKMALPYFKSIYQLSRVAKDGLPAFIGIPRSFFHIRDLTLRISPSL